MILPFISIIIPTHNEEKNLPRLFKSLLDLDYPKNKLEVIIVDGYSTDRTVSIAKKHKAKVVTNPQIVRGAGCQIGINQARGELIAFTDADCVVPPSWLKELVKFFDRKNSQVAGVGGPNVTPESDTLFAKALGDVLLILTSFGSRYGLHAKKTLEIYHNSGCNVIYRKSSVQKVGGFNPYLLTCEDEELDFRLKRYGFKLLYVPWIRVDHYRRSTYKKTLTQAYRYAVGREQAGKLHLSMIRWFHFVPSVLVTSLFISFALIFSSGFITIIAKLYMISVIGFLFLVSIYLSYSRKHASFYVYFLIFLCWLGGWGAGFIFALLKRNSSNDKNLQETWELYWKNYHGVTKVGAWSQKQALQKTFDLIREEGIKEKTKIIDIGCGEGRTFLAFREKGFRNIIGIDNSRESLKICQKNGLKINIDIYKKDILENSYKDQKFDLVFSEGLLEHFEDPEKIIKEMTRISNKYILLIQPNHFSLYGLAIAVLGNIIRHNVKEYTFTKKFFIKKFKNYNFQLKVEKYTLFGEFFILLFQRKH